MKRKLSCILIFAVLFALSACSGSGEPNDSQTSTQLSDEISETSDPEESNTMPYDDYFDSDRLHKPTKEQLMAIAIDANICDVIEAIGKPHDMMLLSGPEIPLIWYTQEGDTFRIAVCVPDDAPYDVSGMEELMRYGVVTRVTLVPPDN